MGETKGLVASDALVAKARKHQSDSDALKLCWQLADALENYATALERQQAVAVAAREAYQFGFHEMSSQETHPEQRKTGFTVAYRGDDDDKMGDLWEELNKALAALDAPPAGDG